MLISDVIVGMLFTCIRIIFICYMFYWYCCFWCALRIFCVRLRITYRTIFLFLDTMLSVGSFLWGISLFFLYNGLVGWCFHCCIFCTGDWMIVVYVRRWEMFLWLSLFFLFIKKNYSERRQMVLLNELIFGTILYSVRIFIFFVCIDSVRICFSCCRRYIWF